MSELNRLIQKLCPDGVQYKALQDVAEYRRGSFPQPYTNPQWYGGDNSMPFVQVADMHDEDFLLTEKTKQQISEIAQPKSIFVKTGTVLVSLQGTLGRVAITQYDCYVDRTIAIFYKIKEDILDKKFFSYVLKQKFEYEKQFARGSTLKTITKEEFSAFTIPVPPIEVQGEIVRILDNFTELTVELTEELTEELTTRKKQYECYKELVFQKALNETIHYSPLNKITDVRDGTHDSPKPTNDGYYLVTSKNVKNGTINFDGSYFISQQDYDAINQRSKVDKWDLLFTMIGTVGEVGLICSEPDFAIKNVGLIKTGNETLGRFLKHYLTTASVKKYVDDNISKGTQVFLALSKLRVLPIPVFSENKQLEIIELLDRVDSLWYSIEKELSTEIEARQKQYEYYRDKLLTFKEASE